MPISIYAQDVEKRTGITSDNMSITDEPEYGIIPNDNIEEAVILSEVISRREETVKHFDLGHGVFQAVSYGSAVHRKDKNGNWQDIDNRLLPVDESVSTYATVDGRTTVSANLNSDRALISLCENGYTISMTPVIESAERNHSKVPIISATAQIVNHSKNTENNAEGLTVKEATKISNTTYAKYSDVFASTDIEYVLVSNDVKENIIVKQPGNSYEYAFQLSLENLIPELTDNGDIILYDLLTGTEEYRIPAPYMYDEAGEVSNKVYYELKELEKGYLICVVADAGWINSDDRVFPVTIDPTIKTSIMYDTYIKSSAPTTNYGLSEELWVSSDCISFLRVSMPSLPSGCQLYSAKLYVYYYYYSNVTSGSLTAGAYKVNHSWYETGSSGLTWNIAAPNTDTYISSTRLSTGVLSGSIGASASSPKTTYFNVTSAVASWYTSPSTNYGIALKYEVGPNGSVILKSCDSGSSYKPYYVITYTEPNIVSGVYKIKNAANGLYLDVYNGNRADGTAVIQFPAQSTDYRLNQMFKITYIGTYGTDVQLNYYSIRTMLDSHKGLDAGYSTSTTRNATIETLSCNDTWADLPYSGLWAISKNGSNYTLKNGGISTDSYLTAPSNSTGGAQVFTSETPTSYSNWVLEAYTGEELYGLGFAEYTTTMIVGERYDFEAYMYSSEIGTNGPVRYSVTNTDGTETDKATINGLGWVRALKPGQIKVRATYTGAPWIWYRTVTIEESLEGTYFFINKQHSKCLQPQPSNQTTMELWDFDGGNDQRWKLIYVSDGYYRIQSVQSGKVVAVKDGKENTNNHELVQELYSGSDRQLWYFEKSSRGNYVIRPRSRFGNNTGYCMGAGDYLILGDGLNVNQRLYTDDSELRDEWELTRLLPTSGYELDYEPSKWSGVVGNYCNCYAYAINNQVYPGTNQLWYKQQPGEYYGISIEYYGDQIVNAVKNDFNQYNSSYNKSLVFIECGQYDICPAGTYKVALTIRPEAPGVSRDYHWYRQDSDGFWSHKLGTTPVKRTDSSGNLIIDPQTSDRGLYTEFVGYFAVAPWSNYYTSTRSNAILEASNESAEIVDKDRIGLISIGMAYSEVTEILESSGVDVGSGAILYEYTLNNSQSIIINYCHNKEGELVVCSIIDVS